MKKRKRTGRSCGYLAGDPVFSPDDFKTEGALLKVAKRTSKAIGERLEGYRMEPDPEYDGYKLILDYRMKGQIFTTVLDREIFKSPRFIEIKDLLNQVSALGEPPYTVVTDDEEKGTERARKHDGPRRTRDGDGAERHLDPALQRSRRDESRSVMGDHHES